MRRRQDGSGMLPNMSMDGIGSGWGAFFFAEGAGNDEYRAWTGYGYKSGGGFITQTLPGFALDEPADADAIVQRLNPTC